MAQHDYNIANASFPTVRTDINNVLSAVNSSNSGSSRPSSAVAGTIWLDTSGAATAQLLKMYDGAADITLATINFTANTVDFTDSSVTVAGLSTSATGTVLTLTDTDIDIPANIGLTFGDDGEKIEGDGTNLTLSSSNNMTLDTAGILVLDGGNQIFISDDGTNYGSLAYDASNFKIVSQVSDKGMVLRGNDGGSFINALSLDFANAGAATFNDKVVAEGGQLTTTGKTLVLGF